ncbi:hypothetical protein [Anabaena sp. CCY 9614]|uniref:hypothetical protein n=1 Tax=Anabaena sp. CCY 9614 TaxID=3103869 RepID=UPI0039C6F0BF
MSSTWVTVELTRLVKDIVDRIYFEILFLATSWVIWQFGNSISGSTTVNCRLMNYSLPDIGKLGVRGEESLY